jgi:hypothetical protein
MTMMRLTPPSNQECGNTPIRVLIRVGKALVLFVAGCLQNSRFKLLSRVLTGRKTPFIWFVAAALLGGAAPGFSYDAELVGLTAMRREHPAINGTGVRVGMVEAAFPNNGFEVNPGDPAVTQPVSLFTWRSDGNTATTYPNSAGTESWHANAVAGNFFGMGFGMATGVSHVVNYEANFFYNSIVQGNSNVLDQIINQSFIFDGLTIPQQAQVEADYDAYAVAHNVLIVSGVNNANDRPPAAGTGYNGIAVGRLDGGSSIGPNWDGRAKPDIVAPEGTTSTATPLISGAATLLLQAAASNQGGAGTAVSATNTSVLKALLLNGAVKPTNWTNGVTRPLDARYGAGNVNVYNSHLQLRGQKRTASYTNSVGAGGPHLPAGVSNSIPSLRGWDFASIQSTTPNDRVAHYIFELPAASAAYSATATLVWKKGSGALRNLDLFLYHADSNTLVTNSISGVDNVEHLFIPSLPAGRYDLQVFRQGGSGQSGTVDYSLAFDFSPAKLSVGRAGANLVVSWPASPAGFVLQSAPSLNSPINWQNLATTSFLSNTMNNVASPLSSSMQFFRLVRP